MASLVKRIVPVVCAICRHSQCVRTPIANISQQHKIQSASVGLYRRFSSTEPKLEKETVTVHFTLPDGKRHSVKAKVGDNLLDVIIENDVDIDGFGACEGTLACSTCHLIFKQEDYKKIEDTPTDEELDMLDLAYGLTDTSRLGCQVIATKEMDGLEVTVPAGVSDARDV